MRGGLVALVCIIMLATAPALRDDKADRVR
jgi:hypothetical protein